MQHPAKVGSMTFPGQSGHQTPCGSPMPLEIRADTESAVGTSGSKMFPQRGIGDR
jgi:hypothetical protein